MAWHNQDPESIQDVGDFEREVLKDTLLLPHVDGTNMSCAFSHIFNGVIQQAITVISGPKFWTQTLLSSSRKKVFLTGMWLNHSKKISYQWVVRNIL